MVSRQFNVDVQQNKDDDNRVTVAITAGDGGSVPHGLIGRIFMRQLTGLDDPANSNPLIYRQPIRLRVRHDSNDVQTVVVTVRPAAEVTPSQLEQAVLDSLGV